MGHRDDPWMGCFGDPWMGCFGDPWMGYKYPLYTRDSLRHRGEV